MPNLHISIASIANWQSSEIRAMKTISWSWQTSSTGQNQMELWLDQDEVRLQGRLFVGDSELPPSIRSSGIYCLSDSWIQLELILPTSTSTSKTNADQKSSTT